jgi:hypothetical protein
VESKHRNGDETCPFGGLGGFGNRRSLEGSETEEGWRTRTRLGGPGSVGASLISGGYPLRLRGMPGIRAPFRPRTDTFAVEARIEASAQRAAVPAGFFGRQRPEQIETAERGIRNQKRKQGQGQGLAADGSIRIIRSDTIGIGCWGQGGTAARRDENRMEEKK